MTKHNWQLSTTKGMMQAWEEVKAMKPGEAEAKFREQLGLKPKELPPTREPREKFAPTREFYAKLKELRATDPEAAAAVDEVIAERMAKEG